LPKKKAHFQTGELKKILALDVGCKTLGGRNAEEGKRGETTEDFEKKVGVWPPTRIIRKLGGSSLPLTEERA